MVKIYETKDVYKKEELEKPEDNKKWYDFIGGSKNLRCFLVDDYIVRSQIKIENSELLDKTLKPIYENKNIAITQDCSYAVPGFYVVRSKTQIATIDIAGNEILCRMIFIIKNIRKALKELFNIEVAKIYSEEKNSKTSNLHFWVLPIHNEYLIDNPGIQRSNLRNYLDKFNFQENKENILKYNESMRKYIEDINLLEKDNELFNLLKNFK
jgi:diadenosine tetraphosphate (Ap4A) HIT family hydrolase